MESNPQSPPVDDNRWGAIDVKIMYPNSFLPSPTTHQWPSGNPNKISAFFHMFHKFPLFSQHNKTTGVPRGPYQEDQDEARAFVLERWAPRACGGLGGNGFTMGFKVSTTNSCKSPHTIRLSDNHGLSYHWVLNQVSIQASEIEFLELFFATIHFGKCHTFARVRSKSSQAGVSDWIVGFWHLPWQALKGLQTLEFAWISLSTRRLSTNRFIGVVYRYVYKYR